MFDVLIIGGGVSGISCALVLGSAKIKILQPIKRLAFSPIKIIITTGSCFNNAYGILQDHWVRFVSAKHQTLIPTLPNIAQISKKKSCGLKGNLQTSR
jgi:predicted flavoprotein YhiN